MDLPDFQEEQKLWKKGYNLVVGVDEVGRGCFAGPIVAGAVAFPFCHAEFSSASHKILKLVQDDNVIIDDSKKMKPRQREKTAAWIAKNAAAVGIGEVSNSIINKLGMRRATHMAFRMALKEAEIRAKTKGEKIHFVLIDAFYIPYVAGLTRKHQKAVVNGDQKSISIAAASIVAKVHRDSLMRKLAKKYPQYGWGRNKGYGTRDHQEAIKKNGITKLHRIAFVETFLAGIVTQQ